MISVGIEVNKFTRTHLIWNYLISDDPSTINSFGQILLVALMFLLLTLGMFLTMANDMKKI